MFDTLTLANDTFQALSTSGVSPVEKARQHKPAQPPTSTLRDMPLSPDEFYEHALAAADTERRLPLSRMTGWDISPFEPDGLSVSPLRPPELPERPRQGEDAADCDSCARRDDGIWRDERWRLSRIPGVGVPLALMLH